MHKPGRIGYFLNQFLCLVEHEVLVGGLTAVENEMQPHDQFPPSGPGAAEYPAPH